MWCKNENEKKRNEITSLLCVYRNQKLKTKNGMSIFCETKKKWSFIDVFVFLLCFDYSKMMMMMIHDYWNDYHPFDDDVGDEHDYYYYHDDFHRFCPHSNPDHHHFHPEIVHLCQIQTMMMFSTILVDSLPIHFYTVKRLPLQYILAEIWHQIWDQYEQIVQQ